jgi:hypothetical protein
VQSGGRGGGADVMGGTSSLEGFEEVPEEESVEGPADSTISPQMMGNGCAIACLRRGEMGTFGPGR